MVTLIEGISKAGVLRGRDGCKRSAFGARVSRSAVRARMTDGPFAETKEHVGACRRGIEEGGDVNSLGPSLREGTLRLMGLSCRVGWIPSRGHGP
jgi:hypothetical protein